MEAKTEKDKKKNQQQKNDIAQKTQSA